MVDGNFCEFVLIVYVKIDVNGEWNIFSLFIVFFK